MRYVTQMKYLHIHNCRDHLLKFKPEQYTCQLKIMPLYIFTYTYIHTYIYIYIWDRGSTVVKVLWYKLLGHWFDPS